MFCYGKCFYGKYMYGKCYFFILSIFNINYYLYYLLYVFINLIIFNIHFYLFIVFYIYIFIYFLYATTSSPFTWWRACPLTVKE